MNIQYNVSNEEELKVSLPDVWLSSPFSNFLRIEPAIRNRDVSFTLEYRESYVGNPSLQAFHGGIVATFIETSAELYFYLTMGEGDFLKAETLTVNYLRPSVASQGPLLAVPSIVRKGRNVSTLNVDLFQKDKMVATGKVIFVLK